MNRTRILVASGIPALGPPMVSAITVRVAEGEDVGEVLETIAAWPDAVGLINPPTSGRIVIGGQIVLDGAQARVNLRTFRRRHLGFVFQKANLIPFLNAVENPATRRAWAAHSTICSGRGRISMVEPRGVAGS